MLNFLIYFRFGLSLSPFPPILSPPGMLQVHTGQDQAWEVDFRTATSPTVNGELFAWDITPLGEDRYHILYQARSYTAVLLDANYGTKSFRFQINGQLVEVNAKDRFDLLLDKLGLSAMADSKVNELKAPMPGLIVDIRVEPGQTVQKGDPLLVLEAMKMENILKAPNEGVVSAIKVQLRDNVTKGQVLIQFS